MDFAAPKALLRAQGEALGVPIKRSEVGRRPAFVNFARLRLAARAGLCPALAGVPVKRIEVELRTEGPCCRNGTPLFADSRAFEILRVRCACGGVARARCARDRDRREHRFGGASPASALRPVAGAEGPRSGPFRVPPSTRACTRRKPAAARSAEGTLGSGRSRGAAWAVRRGAGQSKCGGGQPRWGGGGLRELRSPMARCARRAKPCALPGCGSKASRSSDAALWTSRRLRRRCARRARPCACLCYAARPSATSSHDHPMTFGDSRCETR